MKDPGLSNGINKILEHSNNAMSIATEFLSGVIKKLALDKQRLEKEIFLLKKENSELKEKFGMKE